MLGRGTIQAGEVKTRTHPVDGVLYPNATMPYDRSYREALEWLLKVEV